jgi:hypothetical protein
MLATCIRTDRVAKGDGSSPHKMGGMEWMEFFDGHVDQLSLVCGTSGMEFKIQLIVSWGKGIYSK